MKALVTGGTGFVGGALVRFLRSKGWEVRVLARPTSRVEALQELGVEIVYGNILDAASLRQAMDGCPVLFHAAALYDLWIRDRQELMRTEVEGTRLTLEAALETGVDRVIYTSSSVVIGEPKGQTGTEDTPHRGYFLTVYEEAKFRAEEAARTFLDRGLPLVIVNPSAVYGPGDLKPSGRFVLDVLNRRLPAVSPMFLSLVYIDDAAAGHLAAFEKGAIGRRYILSEGCYDDRELLGLICRLAQVNVPRRIPSWLTRGVAAMGELVARWTGKPPMMSMDTWRLLTHGFRVDGSRANRELSLRYTPLEAGMQNTIQWYRAQGLA